MRRQLAIAVALGFGFSSIALAAKQSDDRERRTFDKCPGRAELDKAADVSWAPQASQLSEHKRFREHMHVPLPIAPTRILFWSRGVHHTSVTFSIVATRNAVGTWHTTGVGEEGPGLLRIEPSPMKALDRDLTSEQGEKLDRLLRDPCLFASPRFQRDPNIVAGGASQTVEIESPTHHWIGSWFGVRTPQEAGLIKLITDR